MNVFITYFVMYTVIYTLVFIIITNISDIITILKSLKKQDAVPTDNNADEKEEDEAIPLGGVVQIIILFFQVAGFLQVSKSFFFSFLKKKCNSFVYIPLHD